MSHHNRSEQIEKRFWDDLNWAREHHTDLLTRYQDQWIAVYNREVVAFGPKLGKVEKQARQKTGRHSVTVYFVDSGYNFYKLLCEVQ